MIVAKYVYTQMKLKETVQPIRSTPSF